MKATPVDFAPLLAKRNIYQVIIENDITSPTLGQYEIRDSTSNTKVSSNFGKAVFAFGLRNAWDGHYSLKGYTLRAGDPVKTG